jgi:hypothetical protein
MDVIAAGRTIWLSEPPVSKPHLWLVLTDVIPAPPRVVAVMLRTATRFTDPTLILQPGDHPFIRHASSVHYSSATFLSLGRIGVALRTGNAHLREDMSEQLLERVRAGLLQSPFTVHAVRDFCRDYFTREQ